MIFTVIGIFDFLTGGDEGDSLEKQLRKLEDILEELVGEIQDEHDQELQIVTSTGNYVYQVHARSPLHDINKFLDVPFPESEDYETLAGMITSERHSVQQGDEFDLSGYRMKILKMFKTLPELVEISLDPSKDL